MPCKLNCDRRSPARFEFCSILCNPKCSHVCFRIPNVPFVDSPRPRPLPRPSPVPLQLIPPQLPSSDHHHHPNGKTLLLRSLVATATLVGAIFMICLLFKKLRARRNSRRNGPALFDTQEQNSPDEDEEEREFDHHIWYINTVGLQQSAIDSITMFKYKKDDRLIDGSDCSICLGEFQDDESLRLLPKCSHAFHVPCIDTWLRSHKNCPLCRAPVMSNYEPAPVEPITNHPPPPPIENAQLETEVVEEENRGDENYGEESSNSRENCEIPVKGLSRTLSDLTVQNQSPDIGQEMRRSVSMDSVSAMAIYQATANLQIPEEGASSSNGALVGVKNSVSISSRNVPFSKRGIGNQSLYNLVKSISIGRSSVPKGAIAMKRFSSKKLRWARHFRSQSSILPI